VPYDDRTHGDLLEEFYLVVAAEIDDLGSHRADLSAEDTARLARLETLLNPKDGEVESGTGDPLADYWEYRLAKDLPVNLDLNEAPPRELWDHPGEAA
jgi:hypothetical protein